MFTRAIATFYFVFSLALLAVAMPGGAPPTKTTTVTSPPKTTTVTVTSPGSTPTGSGSCSTGPIQCCQQTGTVDDPVFGLLLGLLGIVVDGVDVLLGLDCSPITVIGVGTGGSCDANVVCCQNNNVGGLISIGCIPIIL
ncbi:fungal hydrophobin [Lentinus tigrinus ALCF2SS1-7]|uniref:Hydrophobin n=1 Tax=Lentinus tigrinus ALCF2SS1-6 TaxID=1328759 RepID=A0A5C2SWP1_9APHY|nr:fungal hydrophobin [Lentinus tigrinus ALCF2SS1-6]RPD79085.1 fungal hydrophobin [Lentinus tigrinus ALCF2SS1-7]